MALTAPQDILGFIKSELPRQCSSLLDQRDGAFQLVKFLDASVDPSETAQGQCGVWDNCARFYAFQGRFHEALMIYVGMYAKLVNMQKTQDERKHKGTPLVRISEIHGYMGHPLLAKRYVMLTLCEDAIAANGKIPIDSTGSYFLLFGSMAYRTKSFIATLPMLGTHLSWTPKREDFPNGLCKN